MIQILNNFTLTIMLVPLWFQFQPLFNFRLKSSPKKQVDETKMSPPRSPGADVTERLSYKRWQMSAGRNNSDSENQFWKFREFLFLVPCFLTARRMIWNRELKKKKNRKRELCQGRRRKEHLNWLKMGVAETKRDPITKSRNLVSSWWDFHQPYLSIIMLW